MRKIHRIKSVPRRRHHRTDGRRLVAEPLEARTLLAGDLLISELMARNFDTITDEDEDTSDWLEVVNNGAAPVDLHGWHLTDDADELTATAAVAFSFW